MPPGRTVQSNLIIKKRGAFPFLGVLFFLFGFVTCCNNILIPYFKSIFQLDYKQSMLVQFSFFSAYFFFSLPSGWIVKKLGYPRGIGTGLFIAGIGAFAFIPAAQFHIYPLFLLALFILACGITLLQVSANPYAAILGDKEKAAARLNLLQAFNSLGTALAPLASSALFLGSSQNVNFSYFWMGGLFILLTLGVNQIQWPDLPFVQESSQSPPSGSKLFRQLSWGVGGIFCYVGAEVSVGSFLVSDMIHCWSIAPEVAGRYVAYYWGGAMVGRFIGAYFLHRFRAAQCLTFAVSGALTLLCLGILGPRSVSPYFLLAIGVFNSIMFPVIFSLSIQDLGPLASRGAAYLCMAIVGGAIFPLLQGCLSDLYGIEWGFVIPLLGYFYILGFALKNDQHHRSSFVRKSTFSSV